MRICYNIRSKGRYVSLLHSVLGYISPVDYRLKYDGSKVA